MIIYGRGQTGWGSLLFIKKGRQVYSLFEAAAAICSALQKEEKIKRSLVAKNG